MLAIVAEDSALARPLIRHFRLVRPQRSMSFPVYRSRMSGIPEIVLIVSGNHEIEVAASVGYLFGAAAEFASEPRSARPESTIELIAGLFRCGDDGGQTAAIAVVARAALIARPSDRRTASPEAVMAESVRTGKRHSSRAYLPDILYRHGLPEIAVEAVAGDQSAVPAFVRTALGFTGPHRILAVCAKPGTESSAEGSYARTFASLIQTAREAALPHDRTDLDTADQTALRIARSLRLTRTQQNELERLAREWISREGDLPSEIVRFEGSTPKSKAESSKLLAELRVLLGHDRENR